jgi:putative flippase GtrA
MMERTASRPRLQFLRYIVVGAFNTLFSYGVFALLTWLMRGLGSYSYMYAAVLSNFVAISVAFLGYKWFVFRTKGNYLIEWIRCFGVYGTSALIGIGGLPVLVTILRRLLPNPNSAPYLAAAIITVVSMVFSFFGHKNVSFKQRQVRNDGECNG